MKKSDEELDAMLSPKDLSGPERDRILQRVLRDVAPAPMPRPWLRPAAWVVAGAAAAVTAAIFFVPSQGRFREQAGGFRARGGGAATALIEVGCARDVCARGDSLLFAFSNVERAAYFAAYAVSPRGERVWYFPSEAGEPVPVAAGSARAVLARAVRIGPEHDEAGIWTVHAFLLRAPLAREALLRAEAAHDAVIIADAALPVTLEAENAGRRDR